MSESSSGLFSVGVGDCRLEIDFASQAVSVNGVNVSLTPTEYDVLVCLAARTSAVVSLDDLIAAVWGDWFGPRGHVSVHVHHLRRKLGRCGALIVTRRGVGYMLVSNDDGHADSIPPGWGLSSFLDLLQTDGAARSVAWLLSNADRTISWASDSVTALSGWLPEDLLGHVPWDFLHEDDRELRQVVDRGASGTLHAPLPVRLRRPDGSHMRIAVVGRVWRNSTGDFIGGLAEWRSVDMGPSPVEVTLHFDTDSTLLAVEPHAPFLGWNPDELIGSYFSLAGLEPAMSSRALASMVASGVTEQEFAVPAVGPDGVVTPVVATLRLDIEDQRLVGYSGYIRTSGTREPDV